MPVADRHAVLGTPMQAAVPRGIRTARRRDGLLLGRRARVLAGRRASTRPPSATPVATPRTRPTRRSARGRTGHAEVVLVVFDPAKTTYEQMLRAVLGEPRPDPGHAAGQRPRHPVPLGDLLGHRPAHRELPRTPHATRTTSAAREAATPRSPPRSPRRARSTTPRTTTSSTWTRTRGGYCGLGGTGVSCPVGTGVPSPAVT